ncbi:hypothetical protein KUCAC02_031315, partial [Chaenocephalus aceratus]
IRPFAKYTKISQIPDERKDKASQPVLVPSVPLLIGGVKCDPARRMPQWKRRFTEKVLQYYPSIGGKTQGFESLVQPKPNDNHRDRGVICVTPVASREALAVFGIFAIRCGGTVSSADMRFYKDQ